MTRVLASAFAGAGLLFAMATAAVRQPTITGTRHPRDPQARPERLRRDVAFLTHDVRPRDASHPANLDRAAGYLESEFRLAGARVSKQPFRARGHTYQNVVAEFAPPGTKQPLLVIGAHYDVFSERGDFPGADDNASGTAGLLEIARMLHGRQLKTAVMLVAFASEEPPFFGSEEMGSAVHAAALAAEQRPVAAMICLEMIGYYTEHQRWDSWVLRLMYPARGDFIAVAGGWDDRTLTRSVKRSMNGVSGLTAVSFTGPRPMLDASDHRNYWSHGWSAVMVTDTAYERNPNYHTVRDTGDTLDYIRMARVVDGVVAAIEAAPAGLPAPHRSTSTSASSPG